MSWRSVPVSTEGWSKAPRAVTARRERRPGADAHLVAISGLPGVGKTSVAAIVAARTGAVHVSIDAVEEGLLSAGLSSGWQVGVAAYEAARAVAELNLRLGRRVVVDAVNDSEPARQTWRAAARPDPPSQRLVAIGLTRLHAIALIQRIRMTDAAAWGYDVRREPWPERPVLSSC